MKIFIIVLCLAGLVASGVIKNGQRLNLNSIQGSGNDVGRLYTMTTDELLRQKFILDVLKQVELPLQDQNLLQLRLEGITDENLYIGLVDDDMLLVLDLIRNNQMLGRDDICSVTSEQHLRQLIGLYRLFARVRDFETLQRIVVYARKYVNPVLFVNALTLALEDRVDTRMLIVPAIYEILPRLYNEDSLIRVVENVQRGVVNGNVGSSRPKIDDIIELGRNTRFSNARRSERGNIGGGVIDRSQLWLPWREMHRQLALQQSLGERVIIYDQAKQDISVRPIPQEVGTGKRIGLIGEDVGLRSFLNILLDELILKQDILRNSDGDVNTDQGLLRSNSGNNIVTNRDQLLDSDIYNGRVQGYTGTGQGLFRSNSGNNIINRDQLLDSDIYKSRVEGYTGTGQGLLRSNTRNNIVTNRDQLLDSGLYNSRVQGYTGIGQGLFGSKTGNQLLDSDIYNSRVQGYAGTGQGLLGSKTGNNIINRDQLLDSDIYNSRVQGYTGNINKNSIYRNEGDLDDRDRYTSYQNILQNRNNIGIRQNRIYDERVQNTNGDDINVRLLTKDVLGNRDNSRLDTISNVGRLSNIGKGFNDRVGSTYGQGGVNGLTNQRGDNRYLRENDRVDTISNVGRLSNIGNGINDRVGSTYGQGGVNGLTNQRGDNRYLRENDRVDTISNVGRLSNIGNGINDRVGSTYGQGGVNRLTNQRGDNKYVRENDDNIGQLILHHLQQVVARLNIELISLQKTDDLLNTDINNIGLSNGAVRGVVDDIRLDDRSNGVVVAKINEISQRLEKSLQQVILHYSNRQSYYGQINAVDQIQIVRVALSEILQEVMNLAEYVQGGQLSNILENSTTQILLRHIINTVEQQVQRLGRERRTEDVAFNGVNINNLNVDGLRTYVEDADVDLSNIVRDKKIVIGRIPRLNHKAFTINLDLSSDRNQRVVVRTLLGPKTDALGRTVSLAQQRHNFVLLDIANVDLKVGRNVLKRKSGDILWTGRDITPYSEIYERVMRALQGDVDLTNKVIVGQTNLFPHRLLLPRGRIDGLPMQLLVVVTPAVDNGDILEQDRLTQLGLNSLILDNLPIRYPLDRNINDLNTLISLPNVYLKDVIIYHDEQVKRLPQ